MRGGFRNRRTSSRRNRTGRDFVAGDVHGCFRTLERALVQVDFDPVRDRLFGVGDLIDRGPRSQEALDWLSERRIRCALGNHEAMMLSRLRRKDFYGHTDLHALWQQWLVEEDLPRWQEAIEAMPVAMSVETALGDVGIVHAGPISRSWTATLQASHARARRPSRRLFWAGARPAGGDPRAHLSTAPGGRHRPLSASRALPGRTMVVHRHRGRDAVGTAHGAPDRLRADDRDHRGPGAGRMRRRAPARERGMKDLTRRIAANERGRDFVVGDVHGCFETLKLLLDEVRFEPGRDRLFSVGDLIDRGPHSLKAMEWLVEERFTATTMGNHENGLAAFLMGRSQAVYEPWWHTVAGHEQDRSRWAQALWELPLAVTVETGHGDVGIIHAGPVYRDWGRTVEDLDHRRTDAIPDSAPWRLRRRGREAGGESAARR